MKNKNGLYNQPMSPSLRPVCSGRSWLVKLDDKDGAPAGSPCLSFLAGTSALAASGKTVSQLIKQEKLPIHA